MITVKEATLMSFDRERICDKNKSAKKFTD